MILRDKARLIRPESVGDYPGGVRGCPDELGLEAAVRTRAACARISAEELAAAGMTPDFIDHVCSRCWARKDEDND